MAKVVKFWKAFML